LPALHFALPAKRSDTFYLHKAVIEPASPFRHQETEEILKIFLDRPLWREMISEPTVIEVA
jgi:hypothetical protein